MKLESDKHVVCEGSCKECARGLRVYLCDAEDCGGMSVSHIQKSEWSRLCAGCEKKRNRLHQSVCCRHAQPSPSYLWWSWVCPSWGEWTWYSSMLEWKSTAHFTVRCFRLKSYCLSCVKSVASLLSSHHHLFVSARQCSVFTESERQSTFSNERHLCLIHQTFGHPTAQIWTLLTT